MPSQRVVLYDPATGDILQMLEGEAEHVAASATTLDLDAVSIPAEITGDDFPRLDQTHRVVGGMLVEV